MQVTVGGLAGGHPGVPQGGGAAGPRATATATSPATCWRWTTAAATTSPRSGHILHSEGERRSRALCEKVVRRPGAGRHRRDRRADPQRDRTGPAPALIFAVNMLVHTDEGDTFTFGELSAWLREAGFVNPRDVEAPGPSPLVLATKPG